ncbi:hypothetical protein RND71_032033 [Anisodus tanguticus]|uniref:Uncharacterized protein n=1 Tax=Anisodus tanguticus TaxID=243964 RepID=A0AAE1RDS4_9SOLA|nr:hypothetical protein RND71_032033 [Anisodus tanguticus]
MDSYRASRKKQIQSDDEFLHGPRKSKAAPISPAAITGIAVAFSSSATKIFRSHWFSLVAHGFEVVRKLVSFLASRVVDLEKALALPLRNLGGQLAKPMVDVGWVVDDYDHSKAFFH